MKTIETLKSDLLEYMPDGGILRKMMSKDEIKSANQLVKEGLLQKGISDDKQRSVNFHKI